LDALYSLPASGLLVLKGRFVAAPQTSPSALIKKVTEEHICTPKGFPDTIKSTLVGGVHKYKLPLPAKP
jgi:hypothetical protein